MRNCLKPFALALLLCSAGASLAAAELTAEQKLGAFPGCYSIGSGLAGGPTLHLSLIFSTEDHDINGHAQITQALASPVVLKAKVVGSYLSLFILGSPYFVIQGAGYPDLHWPKHSGIGPVLLPNLEFSLNTPTSFSVGGQKGELPGKGRFRYRTSMIGDWGPWFEGKVEEVPCFSKSQA